MPINQNAISQSIIKNVEPGKTPTSGTRLELPIKVGGGLPTLTVEQITDETLRPNRESNADASGHTMAEYDLDMHSRGGAAMDMLIESALSSGAFASAGSGQPFIAKGGETETFFSLLTLLKSGTAGNALLYDDAGCICRSWKITANAKQGADVSFAILGMNRTEKTTDNAVAVTKTPAAAVRHLYNDVKVTVGAQTLAYSSLEFSTEQERDVLVVLGELAAKGIYTSGTRKSTLALKAYRENFDISTLANTTVAVSFSIGTAGNGYKVTFPAAKLMTPTDELDATGILMNLTFDASFDNASNAAIIVEKL